MAHIDGVGIAVDAVSNINRSNHIARPRLKETDHGTAGITGT